MRLILLFTFLGLSLSILAQSPGDGVTDIDGNSYPTVIIGDQEWMAGNLRTTHYVNGDLISNVVVDSIWEELETGAWSYYNNDSSMDLIYGKLYNWYTISDSRQICPSGWRMPSDVDFESLVEYAGGTWEAGGKLKEAGLSNWNSPNSAAVDEYGFSAVPNGSRENGAFEGIGDYAYLWSTWANHPSTRHRWELRHTQSLFAPFNVSRDDGYNCRCLKVASVGIDDNKKGTLGFYPNPIETELNVIVTSSQIGHTYSIMDSSGRVIRTGQLNDLATRIDLSILDTGTYVFVVDGLARSIVKQ